MKALVTMGLNGDAHGPEIVSIPRVRENQPVDFSVGLQV